MRIYPISTVNCGPRITSRNLKTITRPNEEVTFKGVGGSIGSAAGTLVGIGLGLITGGLGAVLIGAMACCGIGGVVGESVNCGKPEEIEENYEDYSVYKYD